MASWSEIMTSKPFFPKNFILRRTGIVIFADIIKIVTISITTTPKDSGIVRRITNYVFDWNLYL